MNEQEREDARKAREERRAKQRKADVQELAHLPAGQRYFYDFLDRTAGVFSGSFPFERGDDGAKTALINAFNEGRRSVGIEVMQELQRLAPVQYQAMVLEAIKTQNYDAATQAAQAVPSTRESASR